MDTKLFVGSFCCILLLLLFYSSSSSQLVLAQVPNWKKFSESAHKFRFFYPPDWQIRSRHDNITGSSEIILIKPNSSRTQVSILYNPNDALLTNAKTGKPIIPSKALARLEEQISLDYIFFNATGKFPHKYKIHNHQSASDIVDYEKSSGKPGKMLIVFSKINDKDSCTVIYSDSKRLFYKNLSNISQIIKSIQVFT